MKRTALLVFLFLVPIAIIAAPLAFADDGSGSGSAITAMGSGSSAGSAAVPTLPDITAHPGEAATTAWGLVKQYGWLWGAMIVLFGIGTAIIKLNDERHWLSKDHALPLVVGLVGTLGAALQAKFAGGSWAGVFVTLFGAVMLLIQKPKPAEPTTTAVAAPAAASPK